MAALLVTTRDAAAFSMKAIGVEGPELERNDGTGHGDELLAVHDALDRLAAHNARKAELGKVRYFVELSFDECAALQAVSGPTAHRDWHS